MEKQELLSIGDLNVWYTEGTPVLNHFSMDLFRNEVVSGSFTGAESPSLSGIIPFGNRGMLFLRKTALFPASPSGSILPTPRNPTAGSRKIWMSWRRAFILRNMRMC